MARSNSKGPNVFAGYWRREEATRAAFVDGWFRTGDLAERAPDGYYTLSGRKSDLIISGGFNIYPREIEEFLQEQEEVAEAAVVGSPDRVRGEVPVAFVVLAAPSSPRRSRNAAADSSRPSKSRAPSSRSTTCPATPWARSKSTCCHPPRRCTLKQEPVGMSARRANLIGVCGGLRNSERWD